MELLDVALAELRLVASSADLGELPDLWELRLVVDVALAAATLRSCALSPVSSADLAEHLVVDVAGELGRAGGSAPVAPAPGSCAWSPASCGRLVELGRSAHRPDAR